MRSALRRHRNVRTLHAEVVDIDPQRHRVILHDQTVAYDTLIVAAGTRSAYFGHEAWQPLAPGLHSIADALDIRQRVLGAFEAAERLPDPVARQAWLTFVIVGGGPTGVELAGALAELAYASLRDDFRQIDSRAAQIILVERSECILPTFHPALARIAQRSLQGRVTIRTGSEISDIHDGGGVVRHAEGEEVIRSHVVLWAAGVQAAPIGARLAERTGAARDRLGRLRVNPDLTIPGHLDIFVVRDLAHFAHTPDGQPLLGIAQVALQQGKYVAKLQQARHRGQSLAPFRYHDLGRMAVIGRNARSSSEERSGSVGS